MSSRATIFSCFILESKNRGYTLHAASLCAANEVQFAFFVCENDALSTDNITVLAFCCSLYLEFACLCAHEYVHACQKRTWENVRFT